MVTVARAGEVLTMTPPKPFAPGSSGATVAAGVGFTTATGDVLVDLRNPKYKRTMDPTRSSRSAAAPPAMSRILLENREAGFGGGGGRGGGTSGFGCAICWARTVFGE